MFYRPNFIIASPLWGYAILVFLLGLQDALMSYATPVFLEYQLNNSLYMGLLMSVASLAGLFFDLLLSHFFSQKSFRFFLLAAVGSAGVFSGLMLFWSPIIVHLIISLAIWGFYYELSQFSHFNFIHTFLKKEDHARAWGVISLIKATAYMLGPLLAGWLIVSDFQPIFRGVLFLVALVLLATFLFLKSIFPHHQTVEKEIPQHGLSQELKIWRLLFARIWPLWLFVLAMLMIDASFWSIGAILSEELRHTHPLGGLLLTVYMLPSLFVGWVTGRLAGPWGKKRIAFGAGLMYGLMLFSLGWVNSVPLLLGLVFLSSIFGAVAMPEILAVFQDFVGRLGILGSEIVSLERSAENLAFILGPILAGGLAQLFGFQLTLAIMGVFLFLVASLAIMVVPRKIHLPQKKLETV